MAKVWLITGSSRGFGRALAEAVLAAGDQLVATARDPSQLADLVERHGERVRAVALDVTDRAAADAAVATALDAFGRLDVLVNNAGYANVAPIEETSEEDFRAQIETNLWGVINVTRAALPVLHAQRSGHVIQFSSTGGRITAPGLAPYQTARWGVEGFSGVLAREVRPLGIRVTSIEPSSFRTDYAGSSMRVAEIGEDYRETVGALAERVRSRRGSEPGDPARAAQVILQVVELDDPPLQLLIGADAVRIMRQADAARMASDERWAELSASADFPDAVSTGYDPGL